MNVNRCPKCDTKCKLSEANVYLGTLVECPACGCKFECIAETFRRPRFRVPLEPVVEPVASTQTDSVNPPPPKRKPTIAWKTFLILMVIWSVLTLLFRFSILTFLFPASWILMAFFRTNRTLYKKANSKTFAYFSFDKGVEIFRALTFVVGFYVVASWLFDGSSDQSTLGYLWQLEDRFTSFKNFLSGYLIFKPWISALLIAILIVIDLVYAYSVGFDPSGEGLNNQKPKSLVSRYLAFQKLSRRAYLVLALLCSFTFFGNAVVGEKIAQVQVRIEKIRSGYEEAKKATEEALTIAVQERLLDDIDNRIAVHRPPSQTDRYYHDIVYTSHDRLESVRKSYSRATSTANVNLEQSLKARVKEVISKPPPAYNGPREVPYSDSLRSGGVTETPPRAESRPANLKELTIGKIEEVNKSLQNTAKLRRSIPAIKLADGTEILVQLPKSFTNVAKGAAFGELTARFPFLAPMIDGLVSAFDKTVEERIKARVGPKLDRLLAKWFPGSTLWQAELQYEAGVIVNETKITVTETVIKDTKTAARPFIEAIAESDKLIKELDGRIEIARVRNQPPPKDVLPEATCTVTARQNYQTRLALAKNTVDRLEAVKRYQSDLARLERERRQFPGLKPG